ncbi:MAG: NAD-dependent epimerase/dehydratase family protein [Actinomycetes bacterium]
MKVLLTGCAGFIGSHTAEALVAAGHSVRGVDSFTDYYDPDRKRANVAGLVGHPAVELVEDDLATADVDALLDGVDAVAHLAGQPGVRASWDAGFAVYVERNVLATQRLLEAARRAGTGRFVYASSSSVYGDAESFPTPEDVVPRPVSPYGVTKLAGEHLASLYGTNFGLPTVSLRYFTVYGPRQRPDMATWRMVEAALHGSSFPLFGDGSAARSFTYVADVAAANLAALDAEVPPGTVVNLSGTETVDVNRLLELVGAAAGTPVPVERRDPEPGDARRTGGDTTRARELLGWTASTPLDEGVTAQVAWQRHH